jgi:hypothetical protein
VHRCRKAISSGKTEKISTLTAEKERIRKSIQNYAEQRSKDERPNLSLPPKNIRNYGL